MTYGGEVSAPLPSPARPVRLEIAVDHPEAALAAVAGGAERLELGASLADGGLTPSLGFIEWALASFQVPVHCLLRPRAGNFIYSPVELAVIEHDLHALKQAGAHGIVFGALTPVGLIDTAALQRIVAQARPMRVCFHRAFDLVGDPSRALDQIIACGADVLLTSGGAASLPEGAGVVAQLAAQAAGRIEIMGGAGVRVGNAGALWQSVPVDTLHDSLRTSWHGSGLENGQNAQMGARDADPLQTVRAEDVRAVLQQLGSERACHLAPLSMESDGVLP